LNQEEVAALDGFSADWPALDSHYEITDGVR
jgi:hypothetical protein